MPVLEVRRRGGQVETHTLTPDSQVLVGQMPSADIVIDEAGVQPIHCRFTLRKAGCEVAAVTEAGVECNGEKVKKAILSHGDTIRLGAVDIVLVSESGPRKVETKPQEERPARKLADERTGRDESLKNVFRPVETTRPAERRKDAPLAARDVSLSTELAQYEAEREDLANRVAATTVKGESFAEQLKEAIGKPRRPGEQELARSPLVIGLTVGTLTLLLSAATLWLMLGRETVARQYAAAQEALEGGRYTEAIAAFEKFIKDHPGSDRVPEARLAMGKARVDQLLSGATPDWTRGMEALQAFLVDYRDQPEFDDPEHQVRNYVVASATRVAEGAAKTAGQTGRRPLLAVSAEAQKLIERYMPQEKAKPLLIELDQARRKAEQAVLKHETFAKTVAGMSEALSNGKTLVALAGYKSLLLRYPDFSGSQRLEERLKAVLEREQQTAKRREVLPKPTAGDRARAGLPPLILLKQTRERSDRTSAGETVVVQVDDAIVGLDSVTGEPRFHRAVGMVPAFFPLAVATATPGWLVHDARHGELLVLNRSDGQVQWRLPLPAPPAGVPLIADGQISLALDSGELLQIDLGTGETQACLTFGQKIGGPVLSDSGERLYVPGNEAVIYVVTRRPLGCERVVYFGHGPGAIVAPMVPMRHYLLIAENDRVDRCRLRLWKVSPEDQPPREISSADVTGQVRDRCLVYGRDLFVPSIPERVTAFTITETDDRQALALAATQQIQSARPSRMFLSAGPDGQLWMASTGLRRFQLSKDGLLPDGPTIATGQATQPMQASGDSLFVVRRLPFSRGVMVTGVDRQRMIGDWQTTVGAPIVGCGRSADGSSLAVTASGDVFRLNADKIAAGGFDPQPLGTLGLGDNPTHPLSTATLADGSLAVWCGGSDPKLFQVAGETPVRTLRITEPLQAAPIQLGDGWLLPMAGKLRLAFRPNTQPIVQDWLMEIGQNELPTWRGVARLDDRHAVAATTGGRVSRVQWNEGEPPHLSEISHWEAGQPIDVPPVVSASGVLVVDATPRLVVLDPNSLEPRSQQPLPGPVMRLFASEDLVFLEFKDRLACLSSAAGQPLQALCEVPLEDAPVGPPAVHGERIVIALRNGRIQMFNRSGKELSNRLVPQALAIGPVRMGDRILVGGVDGSVTSAGELSSQFETKE